MLPHLVFDEELAEIQAEFLSNEYKIFATFYPKRYKSHVLCRMLGHDYFAIEGFNENGQVSEILTCCLRCKIESIRKVTPIQNSSEWIN